MNRKILIAVIAVILIIFIALFALPNMQSGETASINFDKNSLEDRGTLTVDSEDISQDKGYYSSSSADENTVLVKNSGVLKLANSIINKTGDTSSTGDDADFYGINSAVLVNTNGTLDISNVEIVTNSKGSNGIFVTNADGSSGSSSGTDYAQAPGGGEGGSNPPAMPGGGNGSQSGGSPPESQGAEGSSGQAPGASSETIEGTTKADIENVKITTYSDKSRGLDATYNGIINAKNVEINTNGQSCAALATDRGEGEVHVSNSILNTGVDQQSGRGSPLIYSTGNITLDDSKGCAYVSQIACIEGKNSIELTNCDLSAFAGGNRQDGNIYVDLGGIFIYQSMSGDADVGTSIFRAENSNLTINENSTIYNEAPMIHVTNTKAVIDLKSTELNFGSGVFLNVSGQNQWGNDGPNGGNVELKLDSETINGDMIIDSISSLNCSLVSSTLNGAINPSGEFGVTNLTIGSGSTWNLDGDSYLGSLENSGTINYNGHSLYVDGKVYSESNPY